MNTRGTSCGWARGGPEELFLKLNHVSMQEKFWWLRALFSAKRVPRKRSPTGCFIFFFRLFSLSMESSSAAVPTAATAPSLAATSTPTNSSSTKRRKREEPDHHHHEAKKKAKAKPQLPMARTTALFDIDAILADAEKNHASKLPFNKYLVCLYLSRVGNNLPDAIDSIKDDSLEDGFEEDCAEEDRMIRRGGDALQKVLSLFNGVTKERRTRSKMSMRSLLDSTTVWTTLSNCESSFLTYYYIKEEWEKYRDNCAAMRKRQVEERRREREKKLESLEDGEVLDEEDDEDSEEEDSEYSDEEDGYDSPLDVYFQGCHCALTRALGSAAKKPELFSI